MWLSCDETSTKRAISVYCTSLTALNSLTTYIIEKLNEEEGKHVTKYHAGIGTEKSRQKFVVDYAKENSFYIVAISSSALGIFDSSQTL